MKKVFQIFLDPFFFALSMIHEDDGIDLVCAWIEGYNILFPSANQGSSGETSHPAALSRTPSSSSLQRNDESNTNNNNNNNNSPPKLGKGSFLAGVKIPLSVNAPQNLSKSKSVNVIGMMGGGLKRTTPTYDPINGKPRTDST